METGSQVAPSPAWRRVVWTLAAIAVMFGFEHVVLPGVNRVELRNVLRDLHQTSVQPAYSVIALGLQPLIDAFVLVELAALIVPRWRRLRHGGPEGRRALGRAVAIVAILVATVQAHFVVRFLEQLSYTGSEVYSPRHASHWLVALTLVAGTMLLAWLVAVIGSRGIGNGYAVLIVAGWLAGAPWHELHAAGTGGAILAAAVAAIVVIAVVLFDARAGVPLPASGLEPVGTATALLGVLSLLATVGVLVPHGAYEVLHVLDVQIVVAPLLVAVLAFVWAYVFARPRLWRDQLVRAGVAPVDRGAWLRASVLTAAGLAAITALSLAGMKYAPKAAQLGNAWMLLLVVATVLDLRDELPARRRGLVPVWPMHSPVLAAAASERLTAEGIEHHLQSRRTRALLWFGGPYVPIMVLVPAARAADAERLLRALVAPAAALVE